MRLLRECDLLGARSAAWTAWRVWDASHWKSGIPPGGSEPPFYITAFPAGEALRFYYWTGGSLTLVGVGPHAVHRLWQAYIIQRTSNPRRPGVANPLPFPFDSLLGSSFFAGRQFGHRQYGRVSWVFFRLDPAVGQATYGLIAPSGQETNVATLLGQPLKRYLQRNGTVAVVPGEKRRRDYP